jgi:hypothetical protein
VKHPKPSGQQARKILRAVPYAAVGAVVVIAVLWPSQLPGMIVTALAAIAAGRLVEAHDFLATRRNGGRRAARRRRKWQGPASWRDRRKHLSLSAARKQARFTRPQTTGRLPAHEAGVHVGTVRRQRLYVTPEESVLLIGKRAGKSAWLGGAIWDAPGAVAAFSTRPDLYAHTAVPRGERGRLWILDASGGLPSNFAWSPLDGCETDRGALQASGYLMAAAPQGDANAAYFIQKARGWLRLYMHAAILGGASITDVRSWNGDLSDHDALAILDNHPMAVPGWADQLAQILINADGSEAETAIQSTVDSALAWLDDSAMTKAACASPGQWFDAEEFIADGTGTLYIVGDDNAHNPLTPYFSCLNGHLFETAKRLGRASPGGRNDPPFTLATDEVALNKVPLDRWTAEAGGWGITLLAACQSPSQMEALWGKAGGDTVFDNMSKVIFGGLSVAENLEKLSAACGEHDTWERVKDADGKKRRQPAAPRRTFPPERIRTLAKGKALLLHRGVRPLVVDVPQVWDRRDYIPATVSPVSAPLAPLDGAVMAPAVPGHLAPAALSQRDPIDAAAAPTRAAAVPAAIPLEEDPHGR